MNTTIRVKMLASREFLDNTLVKSIAVGLIGGLLATLAMDLLLMGALSILGLHASFCYSIVGDTIARLFSSMRVEVVGGVPLGIATHYLVGPVVGAIYAITGSEVRSFRTKSMKMDILQAVLFVEILSQPMLAMTPILLKMALTDTLQWFGGSFVLHLFWGVVMGGIVHYLLNEKSHQKKA